MLRIVEPKPQLSVSRSLRSWCASILLHGLLAFLLWCIVYTTIDHHSISLTASSSPSTGNVKLELASSDAPSKDLLLPQASAAVTDATVAVETNIAEPLRSNSIDESARPRIEPDSIEFFGTRAYGQRFVFVLDISFSMKARNGERFRRACDELIRSVSQLRPGQSYYVFLFCWYTEEMFYDPEVRYVEASAGHAQRLSQWIYNISLGAGTDPRRALALAHRLNPDAVFLLSDGHFNRPSSPRSETGWVDSEGKRFKAGVAEGVKMVFRDIPIHTIAFENPFTVNAMKEIADITGGRCRYVKTKSHDPLDYHRFTTALRRIEQQYRDDDNPRFEFEDRLSQARDFIREGELVFAEYILRPIRQADEKLIPNKTLSNKLFAILDRELGDLRLEDFQSQ